MLLARNARGIGRAILALLLTGICWHAEAQTPEPPATPIPASAAPTRQQVQQAVEHVRADPLLGHAEPYKTLRFKKHDKGKDESNKGEDESNWDLRWLSDFGTWVAQKLRIIVGVIAAFVVALVFVRLRIWMRARGLGTSGKHAPPPSHVQNLDIRPESLPDVIGAAAAALWQRGEQRAALSLLYRGALSRLVHGYALPIRAASTESECLALANARLDAPRAVFFARLVGLRLPAVYGAHMPETEQVLSLCREFDLQLAPDPQPALDLQLASATGGVI